METKKLGVRILLGVIVGILGIGMLLYLVPQGRHQYRERLAPMSSRRWAMSPLPRTDVQSAVEPHRAEQPRFPPRSGLCTRSRS